MFRGKIVAFNAYVRKGEIPIVNDLSFYLKEIGKKEQSKPKLNIKKEMIRAEID